MSLIEIQKNKLLENLDYVAGRKSFGEHESFVQIETETAHFEVEPNSTPELSIIVPTMERSEETLQTIRSLGVSANYAQIPLEVVIIDNSFTPHLNGVIKDVVESQTHFVKGISSLVYHFDPRLTFPQARNIGISLSSKSSQYIGSWDSDIYCDEKTLHEIFTQWNNHPEYIGLAPSLAGYTGDIEATIKERVVYQDIQSNSETRAKLHMPGSLGDDIGKRDEDVVQTSIMRGAYILRKSDMPNLAATQPDGDYYPRDFVVWSNVPVFMSANELRSKFGYVVSPDALAYHKDDNDVSMGLNMPQREVENLKSLCMLFYRNRVFSGSANSLKEGRLLEYNTGAVQRVLRVDRTEAESVITTLQHVAQAIDMVDNSTDLSIFFDELSVSIEGPMRDFLTKLKPRMTHPEVFARIKQLQQVNTDVPAYYL